MSLTFLPTFGAVLLERAVILERLTFGAHLKGLESTYGPDFFSQNKTSSNSEQEYEIKIPKNVNLKRSKMIRKKI